MQHHEQPGIFRRENTYCTNPREQPEANLNKSTQSAESFRMNPQWWRIQTRPRTPSFAHTALAGLSTQRWKAFAGSDRPAPKREFAVLKVTLRGETAQKVSNIKEQTGVTLDGKDSSVAFRMYGVHSPRRALASALERYIRKSALSYMHQGPPTMPLATQISNAVECRFKTNAKSNAVPYRSGNRWKSNAVMPFQRSRENQCRSIPFRHSLQILYRNTVIPLYRCFHSL